MMQRALLSNGETGRAFHPCSLVWTSVLIKSMCRHIVRVNRFANVRVPPPSNSTEYAFWNVYAQLHLWDIFLHCSVHANFQINGRVTNTDGCAEAVTAAGINVLHFSLSSCTDLALSLQGQLA